MIFRIQHALGGVSAGHVGVTLGHLMALVVPCGVTLGSLALAWRALGVTWDGHLGSLWGHLGFKLAPRLHNGRHVPDIRKTYKLL